MTVTVPGWTGEIAAGLPYPPVFVTVSGQSECFNADTKPFDPCQAPKEAEVEVFVGLDERGEIHDTMLRHVHDFWSATEVRGRALVAVAGRSLEVERAARLARRLDLGAAVTSAVADLALLADAAPARGGRCALIVRADQPA